MGRLYVKHIPKKFNLRTLIIGMGAQHLPSLQSGAVLLPPMLGSTGTATGDGSQARRDCGEATGIGWELTLRTVL
jgi:hypothetical protein